MPNRYLTQRLASKGGIHQAEAVLRVDRVGDTAEAAIQRLWRELFNGIGRRDRAEVYHHVVGILERLPGAVLTGLRDRLASIAMWSQEQTARTLTKTLPRPYLLRATASLQESYGRSGENSGMAGRRSRDLLEFGSLLFQPESVIDLARPLREPAEDLTGDQSFNIFRALLFPPPDREQVDALLDRVLPAHQWQEIGDLNSVSPGYLAGRIADGIAQGKTNREVAMAIRPLFDGSRTRAQRAARTYGLYVSNALQHDTYEQLGDMVLGYQVHSAGGENARHNHALRSGTIYYREPQNGQRGFDRMPQPPHDKDDPPFTEEIMAWNCRCWVTPVLAPLKEIEASPLFSNDDGNLILDPTTYSDWWKQADEKRRYAAAGVRRVVTARQVLGREPAWEDLIDPATGHLLSPREIKAEPTHDRSVRVAKVRQIIMRNREKLRQVQRLGFEASAT